MGNADAIASVKAKAAQHAADLRGIVDDIKRSGITTVRGLADELSPGAFGLLGVTRGTQQQSQGFNRLRNAASVHAN